MSDQPTIGWGIIGPGSIAKTFADALPHSATGRLVAVASRNPEKPVIREWFSGARIHGGYEAILTDPEVDAIYIATPHLAHAEWAIKAAEAGKHVLCEKPIAVSAAEAEAMIAAARRSGTFLGEAFMYRLHPMTARIVDLVRQKTVGELRMIRSSIGFNVAYDPTRRLFANETAGGAILDVGCYPLSMARLLAGAAAGKPFLDPVKLSGVAHFCETGADDWAVATFAFPGGVIGETATSIGVTQENVLRVYGTEGWIEVKDFWFATGKQGGSANIVIHRKDRDPETIAVEEKGWLYAFEIDAAGAAIRGGRQEFAPPGMTWADTLGNMRALDAWRKSVGLEYEFEKPRASRVKVDGRPLSRPSKPMRRRMLPALGREVSVLALGGADVPTYTQMAILCDAFYEAGGNVLDSAWLYGQGRCDRLFGEWMAARGVRDDIVVIGKGAHSPLCYPDVIARQLTESLDRLKTDMIDIYFMHRDNPEVPVGEFVDAMDAEVRAGRIKIYGGSNWSRERMEAAIAHAERNGRQPPNAISNNFSLAEMVNPVWTGVMSSSDDAWKAWLRKNQMPLFAWSSQARGFFTDRAGRDKRDDPELVRAWYSDKNFARRDRAITLAERLGKSPLQVALAYCIHQDFPVIPLIGPLALGELENSLEALDIELTPGDVRWLEQG
ncbi:MAG TPA: aldo/keto reductase [Bauldia sp.]|nr:aldo/keto reductase [Bauldia sp.]